MSCFHVPPNEVFVRDEPDGIYIMARSQQKEKLSSPETRMKWREASSGADVPEDDDIRRWISKGFLIVDGGVAAGFPVVPAGLDRSTTNPESPLELRATAPVYMTLGVTSACNCRCEHCGNDSGALSPSDLSHAEIEDLISQMADFPLLKLNFTGGEPTCCPDLLDYVEQASRSIPRITMTSNGSNITPAFAGELSSAGVDMVKLSLDGMEGFHDVFRRLPGIWRQAMDAVWHLADAGVEVRVQTTLTNANENDVLELVEALAFSGITHQTIVPICPIGRATASMMLTPVAYRSFIVRMTEKVKGLRNRGCTVNYQVRPVFGEQDLFADLKTDAFETLSMKYSCEALLNTMEICPDGTVVPCSFLKGGIGNVRDETISGIWSSLEAEKAYLELAGVCRSGACTACPRAGVTCNGGCLANKIALGTPADPYCFARGD